jgi:hypothetical protein
MLFAIGIVHINLVFIEQNAVPSEITAPHVTKPAVFFLKREKFSRVSPSIIRYAKISR